jgi:hypothetical protein
MSQFRHVGGGLGAPHSLVMERATAAGEKGTRMAEEEEPLLAHPPTHEVATHVRDYERFTRMLKIGALTCLAIGFIVLLIL